VATHKLQAELKKLLAERRKMLQNEAFGGFSTEERLEYQRNLDQVHELLSESQASEVARSCCGSAQVEPQNAKKVKDKRRARGSVA
jgi:predicted Zn-dependent peptidase